MNVIFCNSFQPGATKENDLRMIGTRCKPLICSKRISKMLIGIMKQWKKFLLVLLIAAPMIFYMLQFCKAGISGNPANWGAFGDYVGGVYSVMVTVLVIYLTRVLDKNEAKRVKRQEAAENLYKQIQKIDNQNVDMRIVNKLLRDIEINSLYFADDLKDRLINLYDYFVQLKEGTTNINEGKEQRILTELKRIYES